MTDRFHDELELPLGLWQEDDVVMPEENPDFGQRLQVLWLAQGLRAWRQLLIATCEIGTDMLQFLDKRRAEGSALVLGHHVDAHEIQEALIELS